MSTGLGPKVLVVETRCRGTHDVIPAARKFAQELRRLYGEGYDIRQVTLQGIAVRNDKPVVPKCNLRMVNGELVEKPWPARRR